ncbi:MAG: glycosyltransferase [Nanoarchaeota archaeon]|nr:glycosyltransferase family 2 protein [Nanoarchaeota archaeon]MBU4300705.1 glycosyltransferase family 2 protein [Nanoarchaeota archaeon]MBU4451782.1 glycosyltransferase family 2 protein [Nanoarchaeota archaeon]MCG2723489.1 glycosyltransferase family 2 protein [archaeon]
MYFSDIVFWAVYFFSLYVSVFLLITFFEKRPPPKRLDTIPSVSVIVPAYNEEESIGKTLESLMNLDYPKDLLEIIVVNDGSKDKTQNIAEGFMQKEHHFKLLLINQKNLGKGAALNEGIKRAKGDFVACLDADSMVRSDTLKEMMRYFYEGDIAAVSPLMKVYQPKTILQRLQALEYLLYGFLKCIFSSMNSIHVTSGPFSIYRKSAIQKIGGFDEKTIVEDQEICYRIQRNHYKILQSTTGEVLTIAPKNLSELYNQRCRWFKGSVITIYQYRDMLLNKKYGDFGIFQLPTLVMGLILPFITVTLFFKYFISPIITKISNLFLLNFNIYIPRYTAVELKSLLLMYDYTKIFIIILIFAIGIYWMLKGFKNGSEKLSAYQIIPLLLYFVVYYIILSFIWVGSMFELLVLKRVKRW